MKDFVPQLWNQSLPGDGRAGARLLARLRARLREHWYVLMETLEHVVRNPFTSIFAWTLIGIALSLPLGLYLIQKNLAMLTEPWSTSPGVTVYLQQGITNAGAEALATRLNEDVRIESAIHVSPEQGLEQFSNLVGLDSLMEDLAENPLPGAFDLVLAAQLPSADLEHLVAELEDIPEVRDVIMEGIWLDRVLALSEVAQRLFWVLAGLFGLGALLVTASSVRLVIESRLAELQVMDLVGATPAFMRRPFLYFGVIHGIGGGLMATTLTSAAVILLRDPIQRFLGSYGMQFSASGFDAPLVMLLFASAALIGAAGALAACSSRLKSLDS